MKTFDSGVIAVALAGWAGLVGCTGSVAVEPGGGTGDSACGVDCAGGYVLGTHFGGPKQQNLDDLAVDVDSNVLITGRFEDTLDFGLGAMSCDGRCLFVAKLDRDFNVLWNKSFQGASNHFDGHNHVATDGAGNVILVSGVGDDMDFGTGTLPGAGGPDVVVVKLDPDGNALWSERFGTEEAQQPTDLAVDEADNVLLTGRCRGALDVGTETVACAPADSYWGGFWAKLDPAGNTISALASADWIGGHIAAAPSESVVFGGGALEQVDFGAGPVFSGGKGGIFMAKFGPGGDLSWLEAMEHEGSGKGSNMVTDGAGNVVFASGFFGTIDLGSGPVTSQGADIFLTKLDAGGNPMWGKTFTEEGEQGSGTLATSSTGDILFTGSFKGVLDLGAGPMSAIGNRDMFVAKLDGSGGALWSRNYGSFSAGHQYAPKIAADSDGSAVIAGEFRGSVDFGEGPIDSAGASDIFLLRLAP